MFRSCSVLLLFSIDVMVYYWIIMFSIILKYMF